MSSTSTNKKRHVITLETKKAVIEASVSKNSVELSKQFGLPTSTIKTILGSKAEILKAIDDGGEAKRAKLRTAKHSDLEEALLAWMKEARNQNATISGPLLVEKAMEIAALLGIQGFRGSDGWLSNFKQRHSIVFKENQGEAAGIDLEALGNWQQEVLLQVISHFSPCDVFNADETGFFWQLLPSKTLAFKGERCTSGKKSKERVTVLVGSNMSGTEKLPLFVIGKSANPRAFKNAQVPVEYTSNKKAWMTADLFEKWLKNWDRKLKANKRKVLLFLDNFSGHTNTKLDQITVKFFPPNTTAESQPMDQGIIQNLKVNYRQFLLREHLAAIEDKTEFKPNLLKSLRYLKRAWEAVKPETLANCFRKAGFLRDERLAENLLDGFQDEEEQPAESYEDLDTIWQRLQEEHLVDGVSLADYLAIDEHVVTGGTRTLAEITEGVSRTDMVESDSEVVEEEQELPSVTAREATEALRIVQRYVETNTANAEVQQMCDKLEDFLAADRLKKLKQKNILDYFVPSV